METIRLEIVTPQGILFDDQVKMVTVPGKEGEFGILPHHASLITLLQAGVIEYEKADGTKGLVAINWGHIKIEESGITILADGAVAIGGSDSEIKAKIEEANELIASIGDNDIAIAAAKSKLESAAKGLL
jgi:F-type H+-transporting ATPase subunit epsilon